MILPLLTPVALLADVPEQDLTRGQTGTVVELLERDGGKAVLVEFSDGTGATRHSPLGLHVSRIACVKLRWIINPAPSCLLS